MSEDTVWMALNNDIPDMDRIEITRNLWGRLIGKGSTEYSRTVDVLQNITLTDERSRETLCLKELGTWDVCYYDREPGPLCKHRYPILPNMTRFCKKARIDEIQTSRTWRPLRLDRWTNSAFSMLGPVDDFYREPIELTGGETSGDRHVNVLTIVEWAAFFELRIVQGSAGVRLRPA